MQDSLYEHLNNYEKSGIYPFHMPGHKRNLDFLNIANPVSIDFTEIHSTDNLQNPIGLIANLQEKASKIFSSDETFISVNGATGCVIPAILSAVKPGEKIVFGRNSHMSAYSGLFFSGASAEFVYPEISDEGVSGFISSEQIERAFENAPDVKAVFITSPTYEGIISDIGKISETAHNHRAILIVDEAHGAHFRFEERFPRTAISQGADIVIHSIHKTLPALTSCAFLHINGEMANKGALRMFLNMINSSSPSYVLMSSIDRCVNFLENRKSYFEKFANLLINYREEMSSFKNFRLIDDKYIKESFRNSSAANILDISKLVFIHKKDIGDFDFNGHLRNLGIELEMSANTHFIALTSVADREFGFARLLNALEKIDKELNSRPDFTGKVQAYPRGKAVIPYSEAVYKKGVPAKVCDSIGKICTKSVIPYPPGIPLILPGEIITEEMANYLKNAGICEIEVLE